MVKLSRRVSCVCFFLITHMHTYLEINLKEEEGGREEGRKFQCINFLNIDITASEKCIHPLLHYEKLPLHFVANYLSTESLKPIDLLHPYSWALSEEIKFKLWCGISHLELFFHMHRVTWWNIDPILNVFQLMKKKNRFMWAIWRWLQELQICSCIAPPRGACDSLKARRSRRDTGPPCAPLTEPVPK